MVESVVSIGEQAMLTKTVDVQETQASLQELLSLVREGTEIVLTEGTTPLARMVPIVLAPVQRVAGLHAGAVWTSEDFDEPLPEEFWTETT
jgi:antitoxin (DNA-binding transcriptional repressor) of toxin-antitoxin stability system